MKIYITQYGSLCSMSLNDAKQLAKDVLEHGGYNLRSYKSLKVLKFRTINNPNKYFSFNIRYGNKSIIVFECLDWTKDEWFGFQNLLDDLN